ncbi:DUF6629 family protein [Saccharicrinis fermentans]|uniref:Uncharacterized protein n=1 Tax=Saccharicrinis fermentans DSM 9555 = JCM 21142 TaxID=869213 RepID=W7Y3W9_9BACT|nr:DUF6629 family protein [Saccharicrinis fermentans]GAF02732.1 hypothetical protein JCM21142_41373 [Saccharicrinis fermentans DSM 9555 = JCM 21142]
MCFSAEVSFGASAVISTVGVMAIRKSVNKEQLFLAMIPLLFGIQQFFEGVLWLALENTEYASWTPLATFGFLIFAQLIWPVWVPFSTLMIENNKKRKRLIGASLFLGIVLFFILGYRMIAYDVTAQIDHQHIFYTVGHFKSTNWWSGIFYLLPAAFPFVFSSYRHINYLGFLMLLFFVIAKVFYLKYMISVWCLFGAILSMYIFLILKRREMIR